MGPYYEGTPVTLDAHFTVHGNPQDPTTVTFRVRQPDGTLADYVYGLDPEVHRNGVGEYLCNLGIPPMPGAYQYDAVGTGDVEATLPGEFSVIPSSVVPPPDPPGPKLGPCETWILGEEVAAVCSQAGVGTNIALLDALAVEASMALYEISGRQFPGQCSRTVRPSVDPCSCWGPSSLGLGPWAWTSAVWGGWGWKSEAGDQRGCNPLSIVRLAGYPVTEIVEVKLDGNVLPAVDGHGNPNYRLDDWRHLVRMADPGPPYQQRFWPGCQNLDLADTQSGTFSVTYRWGVAPPQLGRDAAAELACQLWAAANGQPCKVPAGTTKMVRSGVTIERGLLANWFDPTKSTGLVHLDLFLKAYWRTRAGRRSAIWSPDVQEFAQKVGE